MIKRLLITGANGFVGRRACEDLSRGGFEIVAAVRDRADLQAQIPGISQAIPVGDLTSTTNWGPALTGVDAVVHLAARVHQLHESSHRNPSEILNEYRKVNVQATEGLIRAAVQAGVKRFIYLSSMKVMGEGQSTPYRDLPQNEILDQPLDPYGLSKWEAEQTLQKLATEAGMEWVILRPPLVYGPRVKANFYRLMDAVNRGVPLPLGGVKNKRSLLFVGNLVSAIRASLENPRAAGKAFILSDGEDLSTAELIRKMADALKRRPRLIPIPAAWLFFCGRLLGRSAEIQRLLGDFKIDSSGIRANLNWHPPYSVTQGMEETAQWFQNRAKNP